MSIINVGEIRELLESEVTSYRLGKELGLPHQNFDNYRVKGSAVENMRLYMAKKFQDYINRNKNTDAYDTREIKREETLEVTVDSIQEEPHKQSTLAEELEISSLSEAAKASLITDETKRLI